MTCSWAITPKVERAAGFLSALPTNDKFRFLEENERGISDGGRPALSRLIPAGTGFDVQIPPDEPPPPVQPTDDELELERDMEYFVGPEEALGPRGGDLAE